MSQSDAKIWLGYAETDLKAAHALLESGNFFPRQVCFFAQQCGEKALKAILVFEDVYFPKNHDLDRWKNESNKTSNKIASNSHRLAKESA